MFNSVHIYMLIYRYFKKMYFLHCKFNPICLSTNASNQKRHTRTLEEPLHRTSLAIHLLGIEFV